MPGSGDRRSGSTRIWGQEGLVLEFGDKRDGGARIWGQEGREMLRFGDKQVGVGCQGLEVLMRPGRLLRRRSS